MFSKLSDESIFKIIESQKLVYQKLVSSFEKGNTQLAVEGLTEKSFLEASRDSLKISNSIIKNIIFGNICDLTLEKTAYIESKFDYFGAENISFLVGAAFKLATNYDADFIPLENDKNSKLYLKIMAESTDLYRNLIGDTNPNLFLFMTENRELAFNLGFDLNIYDEYLTSLETFNKELVDGREQRALELIDEYSVSTKGIVNLVYGSAHTFSNSLSTWNKSNLDKPFSIERIN